MMVAFGAVPVLVEPVELFQDFDVTHCPTQNRYVLLLEMLISLGRIVQRKTATHFCWKCSGCGTEALDFMIFERHKQANYGIGRRKL